MKRLTLILISIVLSFNLKAQNTTIPDSLLTKTYDELQDSFYNSKPDTLKCIYYANIYFLKAKKKKDLYEMTIGKYYLADIKSNPTIYLNYVDSLINITKKKPNYLYPTTLYIEKGEYYYHRDKKSQALNEFTNAKKYINLYNHDSIEAILNAKIGSLKNSINKLDEALIYHKKSFFIKVKNKYNFSIYSKLESSINISNVYAKLKNKDSVNYFLRISDSLYKSQKDKSIKGYVDMAKGNNYYLIENYTGAITHFKKSLKDIFNDENYTTYSKILTYLGISFDSMKKPKKAYKYHLKVDSLYNEKNITSNYSHNSFKYLYNFYKNGNNLEKQLEYINKFLKVKEFYLEENNKVNETFVNRFDIPKLEEEKQHITNELEKEKNMAKHNTLLFSLIVLLVLFLFGYQYKKRRDLKKQFLKIINQKDIVINSNFRKEVVNKPKENTIPESVISSILKELTDFEKRNGFLDVSLSLKSLADSLQTNTNYLSKVINEKKNCTFSNYISKLRIEYIIEELKENKKLRKYTIKAIANEAGYKNAESFSKAFFKYTKLKPSYFIKELNKNNS